ncbi:MAG: Zn-ribbon domain-containing OB-fold protein [Actinomycetota bacterium]
MRPVPYPDESSQPFWDAASKHELVLQTCDACGVVRHPPRPMCPSCNSFEWSFKPASGRGTIWSWVIAHPPVLPAFADKAPYNVVVVELDEGVRMIGNLLDANATSIEPGMRVHVTFEDIDDEGVSLPQWKLI